MENQLDKKGYLTIDETADYLSLSRRSVERLTSSGALPYAKFGRAIRIPVGSLKNYERSSLETPHMSARARKRFLDAVIDGEVSQS